VTFGHDTRVQQRFTKDYKRIWQLVGKLKTLFSLDKDNEVAFNCLAKFKLIKVNIKL
jgi:hypothetical protein